MSRKYTETEEQVVETVCSQKECAESSVEEQIAVAAYYDWQNSTGGTPVDEETSRQFWLEAERRVAGEDQSE